MIVRAGEGRAKVYEAVKAFGEGDAAGHRRALEEADGKLLHAQDILMAATSEKDLAVALLAAVEKRLR